MDFSRKSPRNFLTIPGKELPIITSLCVVHDTQELLNRELFGKKLFFWNIFLKWLRQISVHRAWVQQNAYNWILPTCKFHRHILCYYNIKTWLAWTNLTYDYSSKDERLKKKM